MRRLTYLLLLLAFIVLNSWVIIHRDNGFRYYPYRPYSYLYVDDSMMYLRNFRIDGDQAQLALSQRPPMAGYQLFIDSVVQPQPVIPEKNSIRFGLQQGIHRYQLVPFESGSFSLSLIIDHNSKNNELIFSSLPGPDLQISRARKWHQKGSVFSNAERDSAIAILEKHTTALTATTDLEKAIAIAQYINSLPNNPEGIPQADLSAFSPLRQIQESRNYNAELACGNYTAIFYYLADAASLVSRLVTFYGGGTNWSYGVHYYTEVYLKEAQQWAAADAMYNIYFPHDVNGRYLNAADIKKISSVDGFAGKWVYRFDGYSLERVPFETVKDGPMYYHISNASLSFWHPNTQPDGSFLSRLLEFYSTGRPYSLYSDTHRNNWPKIFFKYYALAGLIITAVAWLIFEFKHRKTGKAQRLSRQNHFRSQVVSQEQLS